MTDTEISLEVPRGRVDASMRRLTNAYSLYEPDLVPVVIGHQWLWHEPLLYYSDREYKLRRHCEEIRRHFSSVEDDSIPHLFPAWGSSYVVYASAFGAKIRYTEGNIPEVISGAYPGEPPVIQRAEDIDELRIPDPYQDGLMSDLLETIVGWKKRINIPISTSITPSPLTLAMTLRGQTNLLLDFYRNPELVHKLMSICAETVIRFVEAQKNAIDEPTDQTFAEGGVWTPKGIGICLADDFNTMVSPRIYEEFILPYTEKVLATFRGGVLHACGDHTHHCQNYLEMPSLRCVHVFLMRRLDVLSKFKERLGGRKSIIAGEIGESIYPDDIEEYFNKVLTIGAPGGGFALLCVPRTSRELSNGNYEIEKRIVNVAREFTGIRSRDQEPPANQQPAHSCTS